MMHLLAALSKRPPPLAVALAAALVGGIPAASAHPHVFVQARATLNVEDAELSSIEHVWRFDPNFRDGLLAARDADKDGRLSETELAGLADQMIANLAGSNFMTVVRSVDPEQYASTTLIPRDARVLDEPEGLSLRFTLALSVPMTAKGGGLEITLFDRGFYTDVVFVEAPVVRAPAGAHCATATPLRPALEETDRWFLASFDNPLMRQAARLPTQTISAMSSVATLSCAN